MTLFIKDYGGEFAYLASFNQPNAEGTWSLELYSQYSHKTILDVELTIYTTNDRYSEFYFFAPAGFYNEHLEGVYDYYLKKEGVSIETGNMKLVLEPGGETGTTPFVSNNDERRADTYYRPEY